MTATETMSVSLTVRHALIAVFALGLLTGGFVTAMTFQFNGVTGFAASGTQDGPTVTDEVRGEQQDTEEIDPSQISLENRPSLGDEDAPVTIVEFADYQCPFCRKFALETFDQLKENYIDTGKARFVYKDLPLEQLGHNMAAPMAKAAHCAGEQDRYWDMHDKLYDEQQKISPRGTAKFSEEKIPQWAEEIGLDMNAFNQCMQSNRYNDQIQEDLSEAQAVDASGTPTFFINGQKLVGAQPYQAFKQVIDKELEQVS